MADNRDAVVGNYDAPIAVIQTDVKYLKKSYEDVKEDIKDIKTDINKVTTTTAEIKAILNNGSKLNSDHWISSTKIPWIVALVLASIIAAILGIQL